VSYPYQPYTFPPFDRLPLTAPRVDWLWSVATNPLYVLLSGVVLRAFGLSQEASALSGYGFILFLLVFWKRRERTHNSN